MIDQKTLNEALNRKIIGIESTNDGLTIDLIFEDGSWLELTLEADCCSNSYFTKQAYEEADELIGGVLLGMEEITHIDKEKYPDSTPSAEWINWHFLYIVTDKTSVTLDWRNDSNGYYDGSLWVQFSAPVIKA